ncbi:hypothetical protein BCS71_01430 [Vibrio lentus]|uniref:hypothetical protein n=1 Tax=Vibrio lentus TaxID=136468 RepID=UPI000C82E7A9|nr:hypothetical protein [Vibrio lentus]PMI56293.1 hypothetical protein BCU41_11235 [Vibrio lentus]
MDYEADIIPRLKEYEGTTLRSISGKADLFVESVSREEYTVRCSDGKVFTETHRRAKAVLEQLQESNVVHADAALENSGSRRNVPETLIANLPFVEHGKINRRKHLFLKTEETHAIGTLKENDD